jgi:hypothetical protein
MIIKSYLPFFHELEKEGKMERSEMGHGFI